MIGIKRHLFLLFALIALLATLTVRAFTVRAQDEIVVEPGAESESEGVVGMELTIPALLELEIEGSDIIFESILPDGINYSQYIASYTSEGNKIYGLLTIPFGDVPEGGFKAIVFVHGYIPPDVYKTTERYVDYVGYLARSGFVVFKIDLRGHGDSEGESQGSYFSPAYTIDAISALKSLQRMDIVDPDGIGMWGHSMSGNMTLRAMLIEPDIKAGVIWAGAVYSYDDMARYSISDTSFRRPPETSPTVSRRREIMEAHGSPSLESEYWRSVSLTENIEYLQNPLQIHHAVNDDVVNIGYSRELVQVLLDHNKVHEFYQYDTGGHNISSPAFESAMQRTAAFFREHL